MSLAETIKTEMISLCPDFAKVWNDEGDLWTHFDGFSTVHGVFSVFSHYIRDRLAHGADPEFGRVFDYVESKFTDHDSEVDNAVCTCFLENLIDCVPEMMQLLDPYLGPKSRRFFLAWDL